MHTERRRPFARQDSQFSNPITRLSDAGHEKIPYEEEKANSEAVAVDKVASRTYEYKEETDGHYVDGEKIIETADDVATRLISLEDDPSLPVHTGRMWFMGLGMTCFAAVLGQIFYFRPQTVFVSQLFIQVISFMIGKSISTTFPDTSGSSNPCIRWLNPGDFNIKEHVCIVIMSATATDSALAISVFAADDLYYNIRVDYANSIFALLGSQCFGYGLAGLMRSFLVYPTYIVFPSLVPTVNLFDVLHRDKNVLRQAKRKRFFWIFFLAIFVWEWFPEFIAPTLTGISIFCLAKQDSAWVTRIFAGSNGNEGLGLFSICLDWNYVGSGGGSLGALFTPFNTQMSLYVGVAICIVLFCGTYENNLWHAHNFPFLSQKLFYLDGTVYNQTAILNSDLSINDTLLRQNGIPWFSMTNGLNLFCENMAIGSTITHVLIWYFPAMKAAFKEYMSGDQPDPHYQKMRVYNEAPMWWYGVCLVVSVVCAMTTIYTAHSHLTWWQLIVALFLSAALFPAFTTVYATTGFNANAQQLAQMLGAAVAPRNPQANMYFTLYGAHSLSQARGLTRDLKLGQYTKVPPQATFICQIVGTIVGALLQLIVTKTIINSHRELLLSVHGSNIWSGQQVQSWNSNAVSWSIAKEMFSPSRPYFVAPLGTVIGLFVPIPFFFLHKLFPRMHFNSVITPILCWTIAYLNVGINSSIFMTFIVTIFSQFYLRNIDLFGSGVLSAALDGGTQFMTFIASFAVQGAAGNTVAFPTWALNPSGKNYDYCKTLK